MGAYVSTNFFLSRGANFVDSVAHWSIIGIKKEERVDGETWNGLRLAKHQAQRSFTKRVRLDLSEKRHKIKTRL